MEAPQLERQEFFNPRDPKPPKHLPDWKWYIYVDTYISFSNSKLREHQCFLAHARFNKAKKKTWDLLLTYCWWTKSCTTKDDEYPMIYRLLTFPGGAGFCPSTVTCQEEKFNNTNQVPLVSTCFRFPGWPWNAPKLNPNLLTIFRDRNLRTWKNLVLPMEMGKFSHWKTEVNGGVSPLKDFSWNPSFQKKIFPMKWRQVFWKIPRSFLKDSPWRIPHWNSRFDSSVVS